MVDFTQGFAFSAVLGDGLVEQVMAVVQANQAAAITEFGETQFTGSNGNLLDPIVDFHKGEIASPNFPCLTIVAGTPVQRMNDSEDLLEYEISSTDPEQLADWANKYPILLFDLFTTVTDKYRDLTAFMTPLPLIWPGNSESRNTVPPGPGTVKQMMLTWGETATSEMDPESHVPVKKVIPFHLFFHMAEI
jgi:hypothetical protein